MTKYGPITLKWGVTDSTELHDWHEQIIEGDIQRKNIAIVVVDETGSDKAPGGRYRRRGRASTTRPI